MGQLDIVARLQLRADQFSSETGARFAELKTRALSTSQEVRQSFTSSFADIQKMARQSLELPRTTTGSLDLSAEIAALNASASAAENRADAFREMQQAAMRAAAGETQHTEALRRDADAAMVAVRAEEEAAAADRRRIAQLEVLQSELDQTASVTLRMGDAQEHAAKKSGAMQQAMAGASYQVQDLVTQISMGANPITAFVVQGGQLAGQFQSVEGKAGAFAKFMMGPWGLAMQIGAMAAAPVIAALWEEDEAHKAAREAAQKHRDAVLDLARAQEKAIQTAERKQALDVAEIQNQLNAALATRTRLAAVLEATKADLAAALARSKDPTLAGEGGFNPGAVAASVEGRQLAAVTAEAKKNTAAIADLTSGVNIGFSRLVAMKVDARSTPEGRIRSDYERRKEDLLGDPRYQGTANANRLAVALRKLNDERDRELKAIEKRTTKRDADTATTGSITKLLRDAIPGVRITSTTGGKHVTGSDHYKGSAIDFVPKGGMGSMTKADVRAIFERAGVPIRRNAGGVEQLFGPGDKGHADHFHVAWEKGKLALDNYRASTREAAKDQAALKREQRELEASLDAILKALDPAAAAMGRYNDRLADLAKLRAAGKIDDLTQVGYVREAKAELANSQSKIASDQFREVIGGAELDATLKELDDQIKGAWEDLGAQIVDSARDASEVLREGAADLVGMLGVRIPGPLGALLNGNTGRFGDEQATAISDALSRTGIKIDKKSIQDVSSVIGAAGAGRAGGSAFASLTGGKDNAIASSIGGVLGQQAGKALSKPIGDLIGGTLGKTLGSAAGPLGAIAGGIVGNLVGGLFKKSTQASSTLTFGSDGLAAGAAKGNGTAEKAAASASANSVVGSLNRIAEALGGNVTGAGSVSIGYRPNHKDGAYRVDTTGQGRLTGVLAFATEEEAVRAAIADALSDGVISGISAASKRILAAGGDLEKALTKALLIEAVPKDLKAMLDPVGAAIDELNIKFQKTVDALKEGGATADQMAQAQRLYDLQLAEVKNSTASASASLKEFLKSLKLGSDSPLSLRDREAAALADLKPFLTQIDAGQSIDQSKYQEAAQTYLDIERELYGSTAKFFEAFDAVQASTAKAIATIDNAVPVAPGVESPFAKATAESTAATASAAQASAEIQAQNTELLMRMTTAIETIAAGGGGAGSAGAFIGVARAFAA